ncbi:MAG: hypothetical protein M3R35_08195 [Candidatus Eremiobacteraeota bacterium]|nr:hypothetical protein [Candidatus Eremiobacteraeota bacterium]
MKQNRIRAAAVATACAMVLGLAGLVTTTSNAQPLPTPQVTESPMPGSTESPMPMPGSTESPMPSGTESPMPGETPSSTMPTTTNTAPSTMTQPTAPQINALTSNPNGPDWLQKFARHPAHMNSMPMSHAMPMHKMMMKHRMMKHRMMKHPMMPMATPTPKA